jgi:hypothetical protein
MGVSARQSIYKVLSLTTAGQVPMDLWGVAIAVSPLPDSTHRSSSIAYPEGISLTPDRCTPSVANRDQPALRDVSPPFVCRRRKLNSAAIGIVPFTPLWLVSLYNKSYKGTGRPFIGPGRLLP